MGTGKGVVWLAALAVEGCGGVFPALFWRVILLSRIFITQGKQHRTCCLVFARHGRRSKATRTPIVTSPFYLAKSPPKHRRKNSPASRRCQSRQLHHTTLPFPNSGRHPARPPTTCLTPPQSSPVSAASSHPTAKSALHNNTVHPKYSLHFLYAFCISAYAPGLPRSPWRWYETGPLRA